ncbi:putative transcription factor interactor and regulator CCHC(Zn) family protein, partial [Tanacetum coccineum]
MAPKSSKSKISDLDFGDLLYLHASDTTGAPLVNIKLSGTENYNVWSHAMILALETKNKLRSVTEELYMGQIFSKLAMEVWDELKETY